MDFVSILILAAGGLCAYLVGNFSTAIKITRAHDIDIRKVGSGNPGGTNVMRAMGKRYGVMVMILDISKGAAGTAACWALVHFFAPEHVPLGLCIGSLCVVAGHNWPLAYRFRGGKGVATTLGSLFIISWPIGAIVLVVGLLMLAITRRMSVAVLIAISCGMITSVIFVCTDLLTFPAYYLLPTVAVMTAAMFVQHRANLGRIWRGEEKPLWGPKA